jgi:hypothetical protein
MYKHCSSCNSPFLEVSFDEHIDWHKNLEVVKEYKISVFWTDDIEKELANRLRTHLIDQSIPVSKLIYEDPQRLEIPVNEYELADIYRIVEKKRGTCTTSISEIPPVYPE